MNTENIDTAQGGRSLAASAGSRWFRDPDGDLLLRFPVANVYITETPAGWFKPALFTVHLEFDQEGKEPWLYDRSSQEEAEAVRDALIAELCANGAR